MTAELHFFDKVLPLGKNLYYRVGNLVYTCSDLSENDGSAAVRMTDPLDSEVFSWRYPHNPGDWLSLSDLLSSQRSATLQE